MITMPTVRRVSTLLPLALLPALAACEATGAPPVHGAAAEASATGNEAEDGPRALLRLALEEARASAQDSLAQAELEVLLGERTVAEAERDLQHFATERDVELDEARLDLDRAEGRMEDARLELAELEAMYAEEDFAEKTKELVLSRGRRQLEHARRNLDIERRKSSSLEEHELPQRGRELESALLRARGKLEKSRRQQGIAKLAAEKKVLEAEQKLAQAESPEDDG